MASAVVTPEKPAARQRTPVAARFLQSPPAAGLTLGSNDDQLERAQARAARFAASRRKSFVGRADREALPAGEDLLCKAQIVELFQNCIKLASENKINQKNTWELSLIDHLSVIIKVEDDDTETNFQKASCTLEAGVKIYSLRVDSAHSEAYKVLGGINRAGREDGEEAAAEGDCTNTGQEENVVKKEMEKKAFPLSTLESSFEALNLKKFDVAFTVDPLYHQTSAQFDEGGARGLLLNNLGVYGGCRVLFDSMEVPGKSTSEKTSTSLETIDISFASDCIEKMMSGMSIKNEISPTLQDIVALFDEENQRQFAAFTSQKATRYDMDETCDSMMEPEVEIEANQFDGYEPCDFEHEDQLSTADEHSTTIFPNLVSNEEDALGDNYAPHEDERGDNYEEMDYLILGLAFSSKTNAWAGPDHWKYRKAKGSDSILDSSTESQPIAKKPNNRKREAFSIDFTSISALESLDLFAPPKSQKSILLPANRVRSSTLLPEDCHYQPEDLVKLFLLPSVMCIGGKRKHCYEDSRNRSDSCEQPESCLDENESSYPFDFGDAHSDVDDSDGLVSRPRQVNKIEVQYDKSSKQVDVHALKGTLWVCMQELLATSNLENDEALSFRHVLRRLPENCPAAAAKDISPHLCFICLLHLANEHCLSIQHSASFDELFIRMPAGSLNAAKIAI
ncbi:condensin complex subunit 2 [Nymphaea colorata]|nr:condensin complex subunit 2 [Nymphaea colorata]